MNHVPDEFYVKLVAEKQVLGPILDVLLVTLPRDNLLSSACLDIFEYIRKENIKDLIKYLVENYQEKVAALHYIETFREIERCHDNLRGFHPGSSMDNLFMDSEDETGGRRPMPINGRMMEHMGMDSMEEEYWNTSDDEEDKSNKASGPGPLSALVDYHSDEESDENGDVVMKQQEAKSEEKTLVSPPPERLSEKRRREEDDEDELGKMMQHKRRNSQSSIQNAAGAAAAMRKKSFGGGGPGRKIDIRLSMGVQGQGSASE